MPTLFTRRGEDRGLSGQRRRPPAGEQAGEGEPAWLRTQHSYVQVLQSRLDVRIDLHAPGEVSLDDSSLPAMQPLWQGVSEQARPSAGHSLHTGPAGLQPCPAPGRPWLSPISLASCSNLLRLRLMSTTLRPLLASCAGVQGAGSPTYSSCLLLATTIQAPAAEGSAGPGSSQRHSCRRASPWP